MQIVSLGNHLDELQCHDKGKDQPSDGHHDIVREITDHTENAWIPPLRGCADVTGNRADLVVYAVKQPRQAVYNTVCQQASNPVFYFIDNEGDHILSRGSQTGAPCLKTDS